MFERFESDTREKVRRAAELAEAEGASMVEVEHLLLALVDPVTDKVGRALVSAGVTPEALGDARDREFQSALALVGVDTRRAAPAANRRLRRGRSTRFAPSAKLALERSLELATKSPNRHISNEALVNAIIGARAGVVPRLLHELGTNAEELRQAVQQAQ